MPQIVLVVDDDSSIVHALKSILLKNNFQVITANNGDEALKLIKNNIPDLIITDLIMPVMDGWHFNMRIRNEIRLKATPIIVISNLLMPEAEHEEHEPGTYYIPKPLNTSMLMKKIKELLASPPNP